MSSRLTTRSAASRSGLTGLTGGRRRPRALALVLALALGAAACGGDEDPGPPGVTRRLEWTARQAPERRAGPSRVARYQVFKSRPNWTLMAGRVDVDELELPDGSSAGLLRLSGPVGAERAFEVRIDGVFDPQEIDRVAARLAFRGEARVMAALHRAGLEVATGAATSVGSEGLAPVSVRLDAPRDAAPCDQLVLRVEGIDRLGVVDLELYRDPPGAALPPLARPEPVEIGGEWRRASSLVAGRPVESRFQVQSGHSLRIDYGLPRHVRGPELPSKVELTLTGSAGVEHVYGLTFEYDLVVVYSEHDPEYLQRRKLRSKLRRYRSPVQRDKMRDKLMLEAARKKDLPGEVFGEAPPPTPRRQTIDPATLPQGLIDGWITRTVDLAPFVGQDVVARLDLVMPPGAEGLCALAPPLLLGRAAETPLVLLITSDATRADHLTAGGLEGAIETPWLELLARRGTVFAQAWSPTPDPRAACEAILTGRPPLPGLAPPDELRSLPALLHEAGWLTLAVLSSPELRPGAAEVVSAFDQVVAPASDDTGPGFDAKDAIDTLVELLPELNDQPTFVWLQLQDARAPYDPPEEFRRVRYPRDADPRQVDPTREPLPVPEWAEGVNDLGYVESLYAGEVTWIDRRMRPLIEHPRLARTAVVFAGTCGESLRSFGHAAMTPDTLRVPLLLALPGAESRGEGRGTAGARDETPVRAPVQAPVSLLDVGRTVLDLARLPEVPFPGTSLATHLARPDGGRSRAEGGGPAPSQREQAARTAAPEPAAGTDGPGADGSDTDGSIGPGSAAAGSGSPEPGMPAPVATVPEAAARAGERVHFAVAGDGSAAVAIRGQVLLRQPLGPAGLPQDPAVLHDLAIDPDMSVDLSAAEPATVRLLKEQLRRWIEAWHQRPKSAAPGKAPAPNSPVDTPEDGDPVDDAAHGDDAR